MAAQDHGQLAPLSLGYDEAECRGGRAWENRTAHLMVDRKERGDPRAGDKIHLPRA